MKRVYPSKTRSCPWGVGRPLKGGPRLPGDSGAWGLPPCAGYPNPFPSWASGAAAVAVLPRLRPCGSCGTRFIHATLPTHSCVCDPQGMSAVAQKVMRVRSGSVSGLASPGLAISSPGLLPHASASGLVPTAAPPSGLRRDMSPARPLMRHSISGIASTPSPSRPGGLTAYSSYSKEDALSAAAAAAAATVSSANAPPSALLGPTYSAPVPAGTTTASGAPGSPLPPRQTAFRTAQAMSGRLPDVMAESASAAGLALGGCEQQVRGAGGAGRRAVTRVVF
mgnify:CR=1 FL=1